METEYWHWRVTKTDRLPKDEGYVSNTVTRILNQKIQEGFELVLLENVPWIGGHGLTEEIVTCITMVRMTPTPDDL